MTKPVTPELLRKREVKKRWREKNPGVNTARSRVWREANRERSREQARKYYQTYRHKQQARKVFRQYGLTVEKYAAIIAEGCAICGTQVGRIYLDHDHVTGKVRGALCRRHNLAIGLFHDSSAEIAAAVRYLGRF